MKITMIPSCTAAPQTMPCQFLTTVVVNDSVAFDAGTLGFYAEPVDQAAIRHVFLSHSHIDHVASLPIFLENIVGIYEDPVTVHASETVQESLRLDLFNNRLWPNFLELKVNGKKFVHVETIQSGVAVEVEGLRITPIAVHHVVPTLGFIIEDGKTAVALAYDTGPTDEIWQRAKTTPNLKAVFLECTFPDEMNALALISKHLTPAMFVVEMHKLGLPVPFLAVHLKARFREQVAKELLAYKFPNLEIAKFGTTYEF